MRSMAPPMVLQGLLLFKAPTSLRIPFAFVSSSHGRNFTDSRVVVQELRFSSKHSSQNGPALLSGLGRLIGAGVATKRLMERHANKLIPGHVRAFCHTQENRGSDDGGILVRQEKSFTALKEKVVIAARDHLISNAVTSTWGWRACAPSVCLNFKEFLLDPVPINTVWSSGTVYLIFVDDSRFGVVQAKQRVTRDAITTLLGTGKMMEERLTQAKFNPYPIYRNKVPLSELFIGGCVFDDDAKDFALAYGVNVVEVREDECSVVPSSISEGGRVRSSPPQFMLSWMKGTACKSSIPESGQHSLTRFITLLQSEAQHHETLPMVFEDFSTPCVDVSITSNIFITGDYWWKFYTESINKGRFAGDPSTWKLGGRDHGKTSRGKREGFCGEENQQGGFSAQRKKCVTAIFRHLVKRREVWVDLEDCEVDSDGNLFFVWKFMKPSLMEAAGSSGTVDLIHLRNSSVAVVQVEPHVTREAVGRLLGTRKLAEKRLELMRGPYYVGSAPSSELFIGGCAFDDGVKDFAFSCGIGVVEILDERPIVQNPNSISKSNFGWW